MTNMGGPAIRAELRKLVEQHPNGITTRSVADLSGRLPDTTHYHLVKLYIKGEVLRRQPPPPPVGGRAQDVWYPA